MIRNAFHGLRYLNICFPASDTGDGCHLAKGQKSLWVEFVTSPLFRFALSALYTWLNTWSLLLLPCLLPVALPPCLHGLLCFWNFEPKQIPHCVHCLDCLLSGQKKGKECVQAFCLPRMHVFEDQFMFLTELGQIPRTAGLFSGPGCD